MAREAKRDREVDQLTPRPGAYRYAANQNSRPVDRGKVIDMTARRPAQASPYAGAEQSQSVPVEDVAYLKERYGIDYQPDRLQAANQTSQPTARTDTLATNTPTQPPRRYAVPTVAPAVSTPSQPPRRIGVKKRNPVKRKVKKISVVIMSFGFVAALATLQIMSSAFAAATLGLAGWVETIGPLHVAMAFIQYFTGYDLLSLMFIFWALSMGVGLFMIFGLLFIFTFRGMQPVSGKQTGIKLLLVLGVFITASLPVFNLFTIFIAAIWIILVYLLA